MRTFYSNNSLESVEQVTTKLCNLRFYIDMVSDTMIDAGIQPGDRLLVMSHATIHTGDIVVAHVNGESCVKAYCKDEQGNSWLVPCNKRYEAQLLTGEEQVQILGKVVQIVQEYPHLSPEQWRDQIRSARQQPRKQPPAAALVQQVVGQVATRVKCSRQWFAVYRVLVDSEALEKGNFGGFVELLTTQLNPSQHLPTAKDLRRMEVQSFAKPVSRWNKEDAPVCGSRFDDYLAIARYTLQLLQV